jgi:hypothetical protein
MYISLPVHDANSVGCTDLVYFTGSIFAFSRSPRTPNIVLNTEQQRSTMEMRHFRWKSDFVPRLPNICRHKLSIGKALNLSAP